MAAEQRQLTAQVAADAQAKSAQAASHLSLKVMRRLWTALVAPEGLYGAYNQSSLAYAAHALPHLPSSLALTLPVVNNGTPRNFGEWLRLLSTPSMEAKLKHQDQVAHNQSAVWNIDQSKSLLVWTSACAYMEASLSLIAAE